MSEPIADHAVPPLPAEAAPAPLGRRSWAWLAWLVIGGLVVFMVLRRNIAVDKEGQTNKEDRLGKVLLRLQGRYLVGAEDLLHMQASYGTARTFRQGTVAQRLRFVVLAGELAGPGQALKELELLDKEMAKHGVPATKEQAKVRNILGRLYGDYVNFRPDGPSVAGAERAYLRQHLDWYGELALAPADLPEGQEEIAPAAGAAAAIDLAQERKPDQQARQATLAPAYKTFVIVFGGVIIMAFIGLAGFAGLVLLIILFVLGKVKTGVQTGTGNGSIYAETFAVWMVLFLVLYLLAPRIPLDIPPLLLASGATLLSLLALLWPVLRGIPWRVVRQDIGLTPGRRPALEPFIGAGCYAMAIPVVGVGMVIMFVLYQLQRALAGDGNPFAPPGYPSHPIVDTLVRGSLTDRLVVIFLASVVAPVVEETMFRGVLYRHLREASARFGPVLSFLASATAVSFIFAVIHPQGWVAVPVLMALAFGFTLAREWRGSLLPVMVGHGLNNGLVTLALCLLLGDP